MKVRKGSIVVRSSDGAENPTDFRVEKVEGSVAILRDLTNYMRTDERVEGLSVRYQTEIFEPGDIVRVRDEYADRYSESEGSNDLTVVTQHDTSNALTARVEDNCGEKFTILNERLCLVRPGKGFKKGDRVEIDPELAKKFAGEDIMKLWPNTGVLVLTEDSGSRPVQHTSHVYFENRGVDYTNNIPTRWLKLYVEPAKRVVGEEIKAKDIKVGDKVKASFTLAGILNEFTGTVRESHDIFGETTLIAVGCGTFPYESKGAVYTLLEEAPEPVDENLQRLYDAEIGDIAHGTYAGDYYWKKVGEDGWKMLDDRHTYSTEMVFDELFKLKFGELHIYRKVEDAD